MRSYRAPHPTPVEFDRTALPPKKGNLIQTFPPRFTNPQAQVFNLLDLPPDAHKWRLDTPKKFIRIGSAMCGM
jgi:hypothetical protein